MFSLSATLPFCTIVVPIVVPIVVHFAALILFAVTSFSGALPGATADVSCGHFCAQSSADSSSTSVLRPFTILPPTVGPSSSVWSSQPPPPSSLPFLPSFTSRLSWRPRSHGGQEASRITQGGRARGLPNTLRGSSRLWHGFVIFAEASFGTNLIVNGGAESGSAGWALHRVTIRSGSLIGKVGARYFFGGTSSTAWGEQIIDIPAAMLPAIQRGHVVATMGGMLGGYEDHHDYSEVEIVFVGDRSVILPRATPAARGNVKKMIRRTGQYCPVGRTVTQIRVILRFRRYRGTNSDGTVDDLQLFLYDVGVSAAGPNVEMLANPLMVNHPVPATLCPWVGATVGAAPDTAAAASSLLQTTVAPVFATRRAFVINARILSGVAALSVGFKTAADSVILTSANGTAVDTTAAGATTLSMVGCLPEWATHVDAGALGTTFVADNVSMVLHDASFVPFALDTNLLIDPSAEGVIVGCVWGQPTVQSFEAVPSRAGVALLAGPLDAQQTVSIAADAAAVDAGNRYLVLSGWLGGAAGSNDSAVATATFLDASGAAVGRAVSIGPVPLAERGGSAGLELRKVTVCTVPSGARTATIDVSFGGSATAYADALDVRVASKVAGVSPVGCTETATDTPSITNTFSNAPTATATVAATATSNISATVTVARTASSSPSVTIARSASESRSVSASGQVPVLPDSIRVEAALSKAQTGGSPTSMHAANSSQTAYGSDGRRVVYADHAWQEMHLLVFGQTTEGGAASSARARDLTIADRARSADTIPSYAVVLMDGVVVRRAMCPLFSSPCRVGALAFDTGRHRVAVQLRVLEHALATVPSLLPGSRPSFFDLVFVAELAIQQMFASVSPLTKHSANDDWSVATSIASVVNGTAAGMLHLSANVSINVPTFSAAAVVVAASRQRHGVYRSGEGASTATPSFMRDPMWAAVQQRDVFGRTTAPSVQAIPFPLPNARFNVMVVDRFNGTVRSTSSAPSHNVTLTVASAAANMTVSATKALGRSGSVLFAPMSLRPEVPFGFGTTSDDEINRALPSSVSITVTAAITASSVPPIPAGMLQLTGVVCRSRAEPQVVVLSEAQRRHVGNHSSVGPSSSSSASSTAAAKLSIPVVVTIPPALRTINGDLGLRGPLKCAPGGPTSAGLGATAVASGRVNAEVLDVCTARCYVTVDIEDEAVAAFAGGDSTNLTILPSQAPMPTLTTADGVMHPVPVSAREAAAAVAETSTDRGVGVLIRYAPISAALDWRSHRSGVCPRSSNDTTLAESFGSVVGAKDRQSQILRYYGDSGPTVSGATMVLKDAAGRLVPPHAVTVFISPLVEADVASSNKSYAELGSILVASMHEVNHSASADSHCPKEAAGTTAWNVSSVCSLVSSPTPKVYVSRLTNTTTAAPTLALPTMVLNTTAIDAAYALSNALRVVVAATLPQLSVSETTNMTVFSLLPVNQPTVWNSSTADQSRHIRAAAESSSGATLLGVSSQEDSGRLEPSSFHCEESDPGHALGGLLGDDEERYIVGETVAVFNTTLWRRWCEPPPLPQFAVFANETLCSSDLFETHTGLLPSSDSSLRNGAWPYAWCVRGDAAPTAVSSVFDDCTHASASPSDAAVKRQQQRSIDAAAMMRSALASPGPTSAASSMPVVFSSDAAAERSSLYDRRFISAKTTAVIDRQDAVFCAVSAAALVGFGSNASDVACARRDVGALRNSMPPNAPVFDDDSEQTMRQHGGHSVTASLRVLWNTGHIGMAEVLPEDAPLRDTTTSIVRRSDASDRLWAASMPCSKCAVDSTSTSDSRTSIASSFFGADRANSSALTVSSVPWPVITSITGCQDAYPSTGACLLNSTLTVAGYRLSEAFEALDSAGRARVSVAGMGDNVSNTLRSSPDPTSALLLDFMAINRTALLGLNTTVDPSVMQPSPTNHTVLPVAWATPRAFACGRMVRSDASLSALSCGDLQGHAAGLPAFRARLPNAGVRSAKVLLAASKGEHVDVSELFIVPRVTHRWGSSAPTLWLTDKEQKRRAVVPSNPFGSRGQAVFGSRLRGRKTGSVDATDATALSSYHLTDHSGAVVVNTSTPGTLAAGLDAFTFDGSSVMMEGSVSARVTVSFAEEVAATEGCLWAAPNATSAFDAVLSYSNVSRTPTSADAFGTAGGTLMSPWSTAGFHAAASASTWRICGGHGRCVSQRRRCECDSSEADGFWATPDATLRAVAVMHRDSTDDVPRIRADGEKIDDLLHQQVATAEECAVCHPWFAGSELTSGCRTKCPSANQTAGPCTGHGQCHDGRCAACDYGWSGALCSIRCPAVDGVVCGGPIRGTCGPTGDCQCNVRFAGLLCERCAGGFCGAECTLLPFQCGGCASASVPCAANAYCDAASERCRCNPHFFDEPLCSRKCPGAVDGVFYTPGSSSAVICSGHGECIAPTATCDCVSGYAGADCSAICPGGVDNPCTGHGRCMQGTASCVCDATEGDGFWAGASCNKCADGYGGAKCDQTCPVDPATKALCYGHGVCLTDATCRCDVTADSAWGGPECRDCQEGWYGPLCSLQCDVRSSSGGASCRACSGNGRCDDGIHGTGRCICAASDTDGHWRGANCGACEVGWFGLRCDHRCPYSSSTTAAGDAVSSSSSSNLDANSTGVVCGGHGRCADGLAGSGRCECDVGFTRSPITGSCDRCALGFAGPACSPCGLPRSTVSGDGGDNSSSMVPFCSGHGVCGGDNGLSFSAATDAPCVCSEHFSGRLCNDTCAGSLVYAAGQRAWVFAACSDRGPCIDGRCQCPEAWRGDDKCAECADGFFGSACTQCNHSCGAHGHCSSGKAGSGLCVCGEGYGGLQCENKCPVSVDGVMCNGHGACDQATGLCRCTNSGDDGHWVNMNNVAATTTLPVEDVCSTCAPSHAGSVQLNCTSACPVAFPLNGSALTPCADRGLCAAGVCYCSDGSCGTACEYTSRICSTGGANADACPNSCSTHGYCDVPAGYTTAAESTSSSSSSSAASQPQCRCSQGFAGADCSFECPSKCTGHGVCFEGTGCVCVFGYWGPSCSNECPGGAASPCSWRGQCGIDGVCRCAADTGGAACDQRCECSGHGACASGNRCACSANYGGDRCSECAEGFFGDGCTQRCVAGQGSTAGHTCVCLDGFFGADCSGRCGRGGPDAELCSGHGSCGPGGCTCEAEYHGASCDGFCSATRCAELAAAAANTTARQGGHWVCKSEECVCEASASTGFWTGAACDVCRPEYWGSACTLTCSCGHGTCDRTTGACTCHSSAEDGFWSGQFCHVCADAYVGPRCLVRNMPIRDSILPGRVTKFDALDPGVVSDARRGYETTDHAHQVTYFAVGGAVAAIHTDTAEVLAFTSMTDGAIFGPIAWEEKYVLVTATPRNTSTVVAHTLQWPRISFPGYYLGNGAKLNFSDAVDVLSAFGGAIDYLRPAFVAPLRGKKWINPLPSSTRLRPELRAVVELLDNDDEGETTPEHHDIEAVLDQQRALGEQNDQRTRTLTESATVTKRLSQLQSPFLRKLFIENLPNERLNSYFIRDDPLVAVVLFEPMMQLFMMPLGTSIAAYGVAWMSLDGLYGGVMQNEYFSYRDHYLDLASAPLVSGGIFCGSKNSTIASPANITDHQFYAKVALFDNSLDPATGKVRPFLGQPQDVPLNRTAIDAVVHQFHPVTGACVTAVHCVPRASMCVLHCGRGLVVASPTGADLLLSPISLPVMLMDDAGMSTAKGTGPEVTAAVYEPVTERVFIAIVAEQSDRAAASTLFTVSAMTGAVLGVSPRPVLGERVLAVSVQLPRITLAVTVGPQLSLVKAAGYVVDRVAPRVLDGDLISRGRTQVTLFGQAFSSVIETAAQGHGVDLKTLELCHFVDSAGTVSTTRMARYKVSNLRSTDAATSGTTADDEIVCAVPSGLTSTDQCVSVAVGFGLPGKVAVSGHDVTVSFVKSVALEAIRVAGASTDGYGHRAVADATAFTVELTGRGFLLQADRARCGVFSLDAEDDTAPILTMPATVLSLTRAVCSLAPTRVVTPLGTVLRFSHDGLNYGGLFGRAQAAVDQRSWRPFAIVAPHPSSLRVTVPPTFRATNELPLTDVTVEPLDAAGNPMGPTVLRAVAGNAAHLGPVSCSPLISSNPAAVTDAYSANAALITTFIDSDTGVASVPPIVLKRPVASPHYALHCTLQSKFSGAASFTVVPGIVHEVALAAGMDVATWRASTGPRGGTEDSGEIPLMVSVVDAAGNIVADRAQAPPTVLAEWHNDEVIDSGAGTGDATTETATRRVRRSSVGVPSHIPGTYVFPSRIIVVGVHGVGYAVTVTAGGAGGATGAAPAGGELSGALLPLTVTVSTGRCKDGSEYAVPRSVRCAPCPTSGICDGSSSVKVQPRTWRGTQSSYHLYSCQAPAPDGFEGACLGEAECEVGYRGPLCAVCDDGYGRAAGRRCGKCASNGGAWAAVAALLCAVSGAVFFFTWRSIKDGVALLSLPSSDRATAERKSLFQIPDPTSKPRGTGDDHGLMIPSVFRRDRDGSFVRSDQDGPTELKTEVATKGIVPTTVQGSNDKTPGSGVAPKVGASTLILAVKLLISHLQLMSVVALIGGPRLSGDSTVQFLQVVESAVAMPMRLDFSFIACAVAPAQYERLVGIVATALAVAVLTALFRSGLSGLVVALAGGNIEVAAAWIRGVRPQSQRKNTDDGDGDNAGLFSVVYGMLLAKYRSELAGADPHSTLELGVSPRRALTSTQERDIDETSPRPQRVRPVTAPLRTDEQFSALVPASLSPSDDGGQQRSNAAPRRRSGYGPPAQHDHHTITPGGIQRGVNGATPRTTDLASQPQVQSQTEEQTSGQLFQKVGRKPSHPQPLARDDSVAVAPRSQSLTLCDFDGDLSPHVRDSTAVPPPVIDIEGADEVLDGAEIIDGAELFLASVGTDCSRGVEDQDRGGTSPHNLRPEIAEAPNNTASGGAPSTTPRSRPLGSSATVIPMLNDSATVVLTPRAARAGRPRQSSFVSVIIPDPEGMRRRRSNSVSPLRPQSLSARRWSRASSVVSSDSPSRLDMAGQGLMDPGDFLSPAPELALHAAKARQRDTAPVTATVGLGPSSVLQFSAVAAAIIVFLLLPQALQLAGASFRCTTVEYGLDRRRVVLSADFSVECGDRKTVNAALMVLCVFAIGAPLLVVGLVSLFSRVVFVSSNRGPSVVSRLCAALRLTSSKQPADRRQRYLRSGDRARENQQETGDSSEESVGHLKATALFYYFTGAYRPDRWWWEAVSQIVRAAMWVAAVALPDETSRAYAVVWLLWALLLLVAMGRPFKIALLSRMELVSLTTVLIAANGALLSLADPASTTTSTAAFRGTDALQNTGTASYTTIDDGDFVYTTLPLVVTLAAHLFSVVALCGGIAYLAVPLIPEHYTAPIFARWQRHRTESLRLRLRSLREALLRHRPYRLMHVITTYRALSTGEGEEGGHASVGLHKSNSFSIDRLRRSVQLSAGPSPDGEPQGEVSRRDRLTAALFSAQATLLSPALQDAEDGFERVMLTATLAQCYRTETALLRDALFDEAL